jgi:Vacuolar (H+)-ATPase G subunit
MISIDTTYWYPSKSQILFPGKARRLKQAKEEAQDEIEKYRQERERQFKEFEAKVIYDFE